MLKGLHPTMIAALAPFLFSDPRTSMPMQENDTRVEDHAQEMLDLLIAIVIEGDGENAEALRSEAYEIVQRAEGRK